MKYDWENQVPTSLLYAIQDQLADCGVNLIGLAVEKDAEGALILHPDVPTGGIMMSDVFGDILGDARYRYNFCVSNILDDVK